VYDAGSMSDHVVQRDAKNRQAEARLVEQARAGDYEAFEQLVDAHAGRLYSLGMRICRRNEDAEDVVQTTFLKALENLDSFRGEAAFGTWLHRIAANTALKVLRKRRGLPMAAPIDDGGDDEPLPEPQFVARWQDNVEQVVERREFRRELEKALDELDEKYRLVFILRDIEDLSVKDTAEQLGLSESNVKVRLMRARLMLRERLTELFGTGENLHADHHHDHGDTSSGDQGAA